MNPVTLPPNKTYAVRGAILSRVAGAAALTGVLEVIEHPTRDSPPEKARTRRYAVVEFPTDYGRGFRVTKPGGREFYTVALTGRAADDRCSCTGFLQAGNCVHLQALSALSRAGRLSPEG